MTLEEVDEQKRLFLVVVDVRESVVIKAKELGLLLLGRQGRSRTLFLFLLLNATKNPEYCI